MRISPRSSLSIQLIEEATLGPGRFDPKGPPLQTDRPAVGGGASSAPPLLPPVARRDCPRGVDLYRCGATQPPAEPVVIKVKKQPPPTVVGGLLDVWA